MAIMSGPYRARFIFTSSVVTAYRDNQEEAPLGIALRSGVAEQPLRICNKALLLHDREHGATELEIIASSHNRSCTGLPVQAHRLPYPRICVIVASLSLFLLHAQQAPHTTAYLHSMVNSIFLSKERNKVQFTGNRSLTRLLLWQIFTNFQTFQDTFQSNKPLRC